MRRLASSGEGSVVGWQPECTFEEKEGGEGGERMRERTVAGAVFG